MGKMTVEKAKKEIITQIKKKGGLFENCGQKELNAFDIYEQRAEWEELNEWIESLDYNTVKQYL